MVEVDRTHTSGFEEGLLGSRERGAATVNGIVMLVVVVAALAVVAWGVAMAIQGNRGTGGGVVIAGSLVLLFVLCGFYMLQPNQAAAITLFGSYKGTDRTPGLRWVLPC
jgi:uncharacterized membrane protein (DUF485 family)